MHFSRNLIWAFVAASATEAFKVPVDQEDGLYEVTGQDSAKFRRSEVSERDRAMITDWSCEDREVVPPLHLDAAWLRLEDACKDGEKIVPGRGSVYYKIGDIVVYVCSWGGQNFCHPHEIRDSRAKLDLECRGWERGLIEYGPAKRGYGRALAGSDFCV